MTLQEYLNQKEPIKMPYVTLDGSDFKIMDTLKFSDGTTLTHVAVPTIGYSYVLIGKIGEYVGTTLYTTDGDGNRKQPSCFHITQKQADLIRMHVQYHYRK